jgi:hypothetical protein
MRVPQFSQIFAFSLNCSFIMRSDRFGASGAETSDCEEFI